VSLVCEHLRDLAGLRDAGIHRLTRRI
jgi:hypothetical protein